MWGSRGPGAGSFNRALKQFYLKVIPKSVGYEYCTLSLTNPLKQGVE